ncbi:hypothetical protein D3C71_1867640 [compost metagenome]
MSLTCWEMATWPWVMTAPESRALAAQPPTPKSRVAAKAAETTMREVMPNWPLSFAILSSTLVVLVSFSLLIMAFSR